MTDAHTQPRRERIPRGTATWLRPGAVGIEHRLQRAECTIDDLPAVAETDQAFDADGAALSVVCHSRDAQTFANLGP